MMGFKKINSTQWLILLFGGLVLLVVVFVANTSVFNKSRSSQATPSRVVQKPTVTIKVDFSDGNRVIATRSATTAFEALKEVASEKDAIKYKTYDFGVFVEKVQGSANTKEAAWIYSVNGKKAEVAADKYELKDGDSVEWKYESINKP